MRSGPRSRRRGGVRLLALLVSPLLTMPLLGAAAADAASAASPYQRPGETERVSVAFDGLEGNGLSFVPDMSADGRFVAFGSDASNLVPGDTNDSLDIFVHDRATGTTERVSVASDGAEGNDRTGQLAAISADGRFVAFESKASNLVPGDTNDSTDIFVHERASGTTERVSVASDGTQGNKHSFASAISADGRFVAFASDASNLVPGDTVGRDIFVHDRDTETTERVSVASDGTEGNSYSLMAAQNSISADGRFVAFVSDASNLVAGDTNGDPTGLESIMGRDAFIHDRVTGTTERVSVASDGTQGNNWSGRAVISGDGRYVGFTSFASNLVPGDTNNAPDAFVHDRVTGTTERVSVASDGTEDANTGDHVGFISGDGRYVTFNRWKPAWGGFETFLHDRATGTTERVAVASDGTQANHASFGTVVSPDGRYVAFNGRASNLVPDDTNDARDVFFRDRGPDTGIGGLSIQSDADELAFSGWATFSGASVTSADDDRADGSGVGGLTADDLGAEIVAASLVVRPEAADLLLRLELASLPGEGFCVDVNCMSTGGGAPGVVYRWRLTAGETTYEVRAMGAAAASYFVLYECALVCTETERLSGGMGTTGAEVLVAVPLASLGVDEETDLTGVAASTGLGEAATDPLVGLDDVALPDATIPVARVELGLAPASASESEVDFTRQAVLAAGRFSGTVDDASSLLPGAHRVWARACLGEICGARSVEVSVTTPTPTPTGSPTPTPTPSESPAPDTTEVSFAERSQTSGQYSDEALFEASLTDSGGGPIADAELVFELTGAESARSFTATTDSDGIASVTPILEEKPGPHQITVRYDGDDDHAGDADTMSFVVEKEGSALGLTVEGEDDDRTLRARLSDLDTSSEGIAGRTIDFYSDGELLGSAETDTNGVASMPLPPRHRGNNRTYETVFEGDDFYLESSDERPGKGKGGDGGGNATASYAGKMLLM